MSTSLARKVRVSALGTQLSLLGLMALISFWLLWLVPPGKANPFTILTIHLLPLAAFLPSVFRGQPRPHAWLCFVILIYFCEGVIYGGSADSRIQLLGILQSLLTVTLFTSAMLFARWRSRLTREEREAANK